MYIAGPLFGGHEVKKMLKSDTGIHCKENAKQVDNLWNVKKKKKAMYA